MTRAGAPEADGTAVLEAVFGAGGAMFDADGAVIGATGAGATGTGGASGGVNTATLLDGCVGVGAGAGIMPGIGELPGGTIGRCVLPFGSTGAAGGRIAVGSVGRPTVAAG